VILGHPDVLRLIDFAQPVGVLCVAVLHLVADAQDPSGIIGRFRERTAAGSYLVLSQFADDSDRAAMGQLRAVAAGTPVQTYFRGPWVGVRETAAACPSGRTPAASA
jgi:hypothetical protein